MALKGLPLRDLYWNRCCNPLNFKLPLTTSTYDLGNPTMKALLRAQGPHTSPARCLPSTATASACARSPSFKPGAIFSNCVIVTAPPLNRDACAGTTVPARFPQNRLTLHLNCYIAYLHAVIMFQSAFYLPSPNTLFYNCLHLCGNFAGTYRLARS